MDTYRTTEQRARTRGSVTKALRRFVRQHGGSRKAAIARAATMPLTNTSAKGEGR